jgi:hypothetical protein
VVVAMPTACRSRLGFESRPHRQRGSTHLQQV